MRDLADIADRLGSMSPAEVLETFERLGNEVFPEDEPYDVSDDTLTTFYQALVAGSKLYQEAPLEEHQKALLNLLKRTEFQASWKILREQGISDNIIKSTDPTQCSEMYRGILYTLNPAPSFFQVREEGIAALVSSHCLPEDHHYGRPVKTELVVMH